MPDAKPAPLFDVLRKHPSAAMQANFGVDMPRIKTPAEREFGLNPANPGTNFLTRLAQQVLIPPPPRDPFLRPSYLRPDKLLRMGGQHYAEAAGRSADMQALFEASQPGVASFLNRAAPEYSQYTDAFRRTLTNPATLRELPALQQLTPYL